MNQDKLLWQPDEKAILNTNIMAFLNKANDTFHLNLHATQDLHTWSVENIEHFWNLVWDEAGLIGEKGSDVLINKNAMPGAQFFPQAKLNYAQNLLKHSGSQTALVSICEDKLTQSWSWDDLRQHVLNAQTFFSQLGLQKGDTIAAMVPNVAQSVALMLGATSLGLVWSSCSPDFGVKGVLDRFSQIEPKVLIGSDGYWYNGKSIDITQKLEEVSAQLPSLQAVLVIDLLTKQPQIKTSLKTQIYTQLPQVHNAQLQFTAVEFNHPLFIMFSSGTTGIPKCIVHGHGGTLLQHWKEHVLHCDMKPHDRVFYFSTCGWMMWNWLISVLALNATVVLYDGSPFAVRPEFLWDMADQQDLTFFGTSAKYIDACHKEGLEPKRTHKLTSLRTITSTGSPLSEESFGFVYSYIKSNVHLASISGGTDILSCFVLGDPTRPVYAGQIQTAGLGMAVDVFDEKGVSAGFEKGELVCTKPFPSMPISFWNDSEGKKYKAAYFENFSNIWCHGDFAQKTHEGGLVIHGRSDATLNPGGVRIGTAEIYAQVEQIPDVLEALCIGQDWDNDVRVVLFVRLRDGAKLDETLVKTIKQQIRTGASPRHVPAKVISVTDIPRTKSGKIVELAVREVVHAREVKNMEALANPQALELFKNIPELQCA